MTQGKEGEFTMILPAMGVILFYLVVLLTAAVLTLHPLHIPRQLAARITISEVLGTVGLIAFIPPITDIAKSREPRVVGIVVYALLAALYTVLAGVAVVYYWKPQVLLYTLFGVAGVATTACLASDLLSRLPN